MLAILRRIVEEVSAARSLQQALSIIVARVKQAMHVDVCSVYLADSADTQFTLMATDGLNPAAVGVVRLEKGEGLVSVITETKEPLNLEDAPQHPRYRFVVETGEERYHAFLGVPIIHHREVLGVLVVRQHVTRKFHEDEVAFSLTVAAQLAGAIAHARASGGIQTMHEEVVGSTSTMIGLPGAPGVAVGTAVVLYPPTHLEGVPDRKVDDVDKEVDAFHAALERVRSDIRSLEQKIGAALSPADRALFDAYLLMLGSDTLREGTVRRIHAGNWAPGALRETINEQAFVFDAMDDPYMRDRASDVRDLGRRILDHLQRRDHNLPEFPDHTLLIGEEITATMLAEVPVGKLKGVVSARGSTSSHVAILAHAMGIPAVVGISDLPVAWIDGRELIVDGYRGRIFISPNEAIRQEFSRLAREEEELAAGLESLRFEPSITPDNEHIPLYANTGLLSDITPSLNRGAEGIGLYRTEFPFMVRDRFPGEEEQRAIYHQVLEAFAPRPVTLRTLDIGGDKTLPYFPIIEDNPFLGWRGIRVTLDHPEIFLVQLRAMLRANIGLNNLHILLPMVSSVSELDEAMRLLERVYTELKNIDESVMPPRVGVMVEVPSTIYQIDSIAKRVDFLSVGTNDLVQYLLAVDRNNSAVAALYDNFHPAVLAALKQAIDGAHRYNKTIGVCGEMAGDPASALLLVGMGVDNLSMSVACLPRVKWVIRNFTRDQASEFVRDVLTMEDSKAIRRYLDTRLEKVGLGGLIRAGK